ncbi:hypothetical protein MSNKSG1_15502 [Marinobacter santoriniensis NKSG1]|uniref:Putative DNA-binding domain-containing protein n=2 Tax=Marinobacter santoriniensis TaxID=523742 RepID=M7D1V0_9GAMM|nr:hypothetical protein MSNKSG1_15502 [Marinobacter santoriniensis NKSG1]
MAQTLRGLDSTVGLAPLCDGPDVQDRIEIYRYHISSTLADAINTTYPMTRRYIGDPPFEHFVQRFVRAYPPETGCLTDYGEAVSAALAAEPEMPVGAADLAAFEWGLERTGLARSATPFPFGAFAAQALNHLEEITFVLAPGVRLFQADWPVVEAYDRLQEGRPVVPAAAQPHAIWLLHRHARGVSVSEASEALVDIVACCTNGQPLASLGDSLADEHVDALFDLVNRGVIESFATDTPPAGPGTEPHHPK